MPIITVTSKLRPLNRLVCGLSPGARPLSSSSKHLGWLQLHGANGSPYTRKVMSALRYKHVPFTFHQLMPGDFMGDWNDKGFGHIKPKV